MGMFWDEFHMVMFLLLYLANVLKNDVLLVSLIPSRFSRCGKIYENMG